MPKAILEFNLPEESQEFEMANKGACAHIVLEELDQWLRAKWKYEGQESVSIEEVRKHLRELMEAYNVCQSY